MSKRSEKSKKGRKVVRIVASDEEVTEDDKKVFCLAHVGASLLGEKGGVIITALSHKKMRVRGGQR